MGACPPAISIDSPGDELACLCARSRRPLHVLHLDDAMVVIDKPSGLVVHRGWGDDVEVVVALLRDQLGRRVLPVHRLDRGTSGALVFAFEPGAARRLHEAFEEGRVVKRYLAVVRGVPPEEGVVDQPIPRREDGPRVPAATSFRRLATCAIESSPLREARYSVVEAIPRSGRLHQVRRHLKHLAHPVLGDANYGRSEHNRLVRERFGLERLALHAASIELAHPVTATPMSVRAPLPLDLREPLERMGIATSALEP